MSFLARFLGRTPRITLSNVPAANSLEIYHRTPPWWARWVLVLVAVDTMVTTSMMEFTWFHWGTMEPKAKSSNDISTGDSEELEFVPRPYAVRSVACFMHFATGCGVAGALLATRSRMIRSIHVLKAARTTHNSKPQSRILVETASMPLGKGAVWSLPPCKIVVDSNPAYLQLQTATHGRWAMNMRGPTIQGAPGEQPKNAEEAQKMFLAAWRRFGGQTVSAKQRGTGGKK